MSKFHMRGHLARLAASTPALPLLDEESGCTIWVKLEYLLPSGSTKDRVASFILSHGIETGRIKPTSIVVEASSGSTSISLAMACATLGVAFRAVMPESVSRERVLIIRRYGGEVVLSPRSGGIQGALDETRRMAELDSRVFLTRQFENPLNALVHQRITGPELIAQVGSTIHGFVAGVGTGGTLMGIARALREAGQPTHIARAMPSSGAGFCGEPEVCGGIPGIVDGMSRLLMPEAIDLGEPITVSDGEAVRAARELGARGLPVGPSSGLNFAAARALCRKLGHGHNVATVFCDRMERYFSSDLFADLVQEQAAAGIR